jgi:hypothetical protein
MSTIRATSTGCAKKVILGIGLIVGMSLVVMVVLTPIIVFVGPPVGLATLGGIVCLALVVRHWRGHSGSA